MAGHVQDHAIAPDIAPDLGLAIFQLAVREIDTRISNRPGDLIATLSFLTGRIVQRTAFRDAPNGFTIDQSDNGVLFLRHDWVTAKLGALRSGSLASALVDASVLAGARAFPKFGTVRQDAYEAMQRRGGYDLRGNVLTASPEELAGEIQSDVDGLLFDADDRTSLFKACCIASGHAISYVRHRLQPVEAAELALSIAYHAGWIDQRKSGRSQLRS